MAGPRKCPLVIERESEFKLMSPIVRFVRDKSGEMYVGQVYLRSPSSERQSNACIVEAKLGKSILKSSYENKSAGLGRISIRLSRDLWDSFSTEDSPPLRPENCAGRVLKRTSIVAVCSVYSVRG